MRNLELEAWIHLFEDESVHMQKIGASLKIIFLMKGAA